MDVQLGNIIEKIKKEGVEEAQQKAQQIIREAEIKAAGMIEEAEKRAKLLNEEAGKNAVEFQSKSKKAIQQAARDSLLLLKNQITDLFERVFQKQIANTMDPQFTGNLILRIADQWSKNSETEIKVSEKEIEQIEKIVSAGLKKEFKQTITLRPSPSIEHGFQLGIKGENFYHDFTDQSISETLKLFLNQKLKTILDQKNG